MLRRAVVLAPLVLLPAVPPAAARESRYLEDFEFLRETVERDYAALKSKDIDWPRECARLRPLFEECASDADHVKNVMRMLAVLRDSHSGVTRSEVPWDQLPSKWDGLYGGGLRVEWDQGRLVVTGLMEGHPLGSTVPPGSTIAAIGGQPAWMAMERERRRITEFLGTSSDHSLFASMDNRMLPFGEKQQVDVVVLTPEGKERRVQVSRWGPGGRAFDTLSATLPEGMEPARGAVARFLDAPWGGRRLGYVRVTGGMDGETVAAFHAAFDTLRGMEACLLDCRGMGGGGDGAAWEIAGRFFPKGADNGLHGRIEPSGAWQFDGPVVMLQDSQEVSSAETFTWAMSETGRAVSVGRPTGGWGIIPKGYDCPSGLVGFRLGVNDRPTPIRRVRTEGVGWPPDVLVPFGPAVCARFDPVREIGTQALVLLHDGAKTEDVRRLFGGLFAGRVAEFEKGAKAHASAGGFEPRRLAKLAAEDLEARLALETDLLGLEDAGPPDVLGARARLAILEPAAAAAGLKAPLARLAAALKKLAPEAAAQEEFLALTDRGLDAPPKDRERFLFRHRRTRLAQYLREGPWKE